MLDQAERLLRDENETLRERVRQLEQILAGNDEPSGAIERLLTRSEFRIWRALKNRPIATKDALFASLYRDFGIEHFSEQTIAVFLFRLRRKLRPLGIEIKNIWSVGWVLTDESREKMKELEAGEVDPLPAPQPRGSVAAAASLARRQLRAPAD